MKVWEGTPLVDVLSITYLGTDDVPPEEQTGTISFWQPFNYEEERTLVYEGDNDDNPKQSIKYGDVINFRVNGPIRVSKDTNNILHMDFFNLFNGAYKGNLNFSWQPEDGSHFVRRRELNSTDGTRKILVMTGHYANATVANVEVKLRGTAATSVYYGGIFASNSKLDLPHSVNVLFLKKHDNTITVGQDDVIPFCKSAVGVPLNSVLKVDMSLIVDGVDHVATVEFNRYNKVEEKITTTNKKSRISVRVTWERMITLFPADSHSGVEVTEDQALKFHLLKDKIEKNNEIKPSYHLPAISSKILVKAIELCKYKMNPYFLDELSIQLDPDTLFNLIQVFHFSTYSRVS